MKQKQEDRGASASRPGCEPTASAADGGFAESHPSRGMLHRTIYHSCIICHGTGRAFDADCRSCTDPDPVLARKVLERLRPPQMAFLRAYGHTLAEQPVTGEEWDAHLIEFYVEDDDGVWDDDGLIFPPTRYWFASGHCRMGPCGFATFIRYNPLGLLLRECLMAGADGHVAPCDSDGPRMAETNADSARGEAGPARAEGIAPPPPSGEHHGR